MSEPRVVVAHREHLWWLLAEAAQLEHMIMCQYLYAEASLKDGTADGLTEQQAAAVERWRGVLRGIAVRELWIARVVCSSSSRALTSSMRRQITSATKQSSPLTRYTERTRGLPVSRRSTSLA